MKSTIKLLPLLTVFAVLFASCKPEPAKAPRGYWEYRGDTPGGYEAVIRMTVAGGPFIRFMGFAPPSGKLSSRAEYEELIKKFDRYWLQLPEMLTKFEDNKFIGIGGEVDGKTLFEYDPATQEIVSLQKGTEGLRLKRISHFELLDFPKYRESSVKAGLSGWDATPAN